MPPSKVRYSSIVIRTSTIFIVSWLNLQLQFLKLQVLLLLKEPHSWLSEIPGVQFLRVYDLLLQNIPWYLHSLCHVHGTHNPICRCIALGMYRPAVCMSERRCFDHLSSLGHTSGHECEPNGSPSSRE
jgi:hypothetical protein